MRSEALPPARVPPLRLAAAALLIAIATLAVYAPVQGHPFLSWDDPVYVSENPNLREPLGLASVVRAFTEPYESNWIPLTWISLHVDAALFGLDPTAYHVENVLLHLAAALCLLLALVRATGALGPAAFVAAVFALHPAHVESVAWVSQRKDCLSGFFFMLTLYAHVRYAAAPTLACRLAVVAAGCAAMLAKPVAVVLPLALWVLDYWPLARLGIDGPDERGAFAVDRGLLVRRLLEKWPLVVMALLAGGMTVLAQRSAGSVELLQLPLSWRVLNALRNFALYLATSLWPSGLSYYYTWPVLGPRFAAESLAAGAAFALVGWAALRAARRQRAALAGWAWYVVTLLPVVGFVQVGMQAHADRYLYLPLVGVAMAVAFGLRPFAVTAVGRRALVAAALAVLLAFGLASRAQLRHWRSSEALYRRALAVDEDNFFAHVSLAGELARTGRLDEAARHYARALALRPRWYAPHLQAARLARLRGDLAAALSLSERAASLRPALAEPRAAQIDLLIAAGRHDEARQRLERALAELPPAEAQRLRALRERMARRPAAAAPAASPAVQGPAPGARQ